MDSRIWRPLSSISTNSVDIITSISVMVSITIHPPPSNPSHPQTHQSHYLEHQQHHDHRDYHQGINANHIPYHDPEADHHSFIWTVFLVVSCVQKSVLAFSTIYYETYATRPRAQSGAHSLHPHYPQIEWSCWNAIPLLSSSSRLRRSSKAQCAHIFLLVATRWNQS